MASFYRSMGRLAGRAMRNQAVNTAVSKASRTLYREMTLADIKLKRRLLEKKRAHHITLLGKTVYHLTANGHDPLADAHTLTITRVLKEIDLEIEAATDEIERRKAASSNGPAGNT